MSVPCPLSFSLSLLSTPLSCPRSRLLFPFFCAQPRAQPGSEPLLLARRGRLSQRGSRLWSVLYIGLDGRSFPSAAAVLRATGRLPPVGGGCGGEEEAEESATVSCPRHAHSSCIQVGVTRVRALCTATEREGAGGGGGGSNDDGIGLDACSKRRLTPPPCRWRCDGTGGVQAGRQTWPAAPARWSGAAPPSERADGRPVQSARSVWSHHTPAWCDLSRVTLRMEGVLTCSQRPAISWLLGVRPPRRGGGVAGSGRGAAHIRTSGCKQHKLFMMI